MARKKDSPQKAALREMMGSLHEGEQRKDQRWNRC